MHHVVMFSSGAGSAMAAKRVATSIMEPGDHLTLMFADVNMEHPDNYRFLHEAHEWIGGDLLILTNDGKTIWDVFREGRFLGNSRVDLCSRVLKREPMRKVLEERFDPSDTTVYLGFDWTEEHRHLRAVPHWEPWPVRSPLCEEPFIDKAQAMKEMEAVGLLPPLLTRQGFPHANCGGGCVKAGMKQFRKLLRTDPGTYREWEHQEEEVRVHLGKDVSILRSRAGGTTRPLTLREFRMEEEGQMDLDAEWGGCNCMTPPEGDVGETGVEISTALQLIERPQPVSSYYDKDEEF